MKHLIDYKLFEAVGAGEKYLLNLSSANSILGAKSWMSGSDRITDTIKSSAEKNWSLTTTLSKISPSPRLRRLSNNDLAQEINLSHKAGAPRLRLREERDETSINLNKRFRRLFGKFKNNLEIDKKVEFMSKLKENGYTFCSNSDIIKIINFEDLEEEIDLISYIFEYEFLHPV